MKIEKKRKTILIVLGVLMMIIVASFELTSRNAMKPMKEEGNRAEFENISLVSKKYLNRIRYSILGKDGNKVIHNKNYIQDNILNNNLKFKEILNITSEYESGFKNLSVGDNTYIINIENNDTESYFKILCYEKDNKSKKIEKNIYIKKSDNKKIVSLVEVLEKDGVLYAVVTSDVEEVSVVSFDLHKDNYQILDTLKMNDSLYPNLYTSDWSEDDKYIYITLMNSESETIKNLYIARYDFKSKKFLKEVNLEGIEIDKGFDDIINVYLDQNTGNKYEVFVTNKDGYMYKFTYDLNTMKLENKERLNLKINTIEKNNFNESEKMNSFVLRKNKIYYISYNTENIYRKDESSNDNSNELAKFVIFDIAKNKTVYSATFKNSDINEPIFISE